MACKKYKQQFDDWFLSVLHILDQEIYSLISKNYIIWRIHCMTILGVMQVKFWVLNAASWGLSAEYYKILQLLENTKWYLVKSETGPLADTSLYADWLSPQWSPITPSLPVQSRETRPTDWQSCALCRGNKTARQGNCVLNIQTRPS